jgi:hypothetical protein
MSTPTLGRQPTARSSTAPPSGAPWNAGIVSHSRRTRTISVDADRVGTTDFTQSQAQRDLLIANGRKAATDFLDAFELAAYENTYHAAVPAA